jgi:diacylglycerol kinase family enzyme
VLNTSSIGSYVMFVRVRERIEHAGVPYRIASLLAFVRVLLSLRRLGVAVEVDGERRLYRTPLVFVGVGERELAAPTLGGRVEGGRAGLHVIVVRGRTRTGLLLLGVAMAARGLRAATGREAHGVDAFMTDALSVEIARPRARIAVDGELAVTTPPVEYRHAPGAVRVVMPPPEPREGAQGDAGA